MKKKEIIFLISFSEIGVYLNFQKGAKNLNLGHNNLIFGPIWSKSLNLNVQNLDFPQKKI